VCVSVWVSASRERRESVCVKAQERAGGDVLVFENAALSPGSVILDSKTILLTMSSSDDEPPVEDEAAAPAPNGESLSAQQLSSHPVWAASRGDAPRSSGPPPFSKKKSRAPSEAGDAPAAPKFERISLVELEAKQHADADGADSCIDSEDEEWTRVKSATPKRKRTAPSGPREELDDDDDQSSEDDSENKRKKLAGFLGAAAFGGGGSNVHYGASDAASEQSATSTQRRKDAMKDAFPVRGVSCVGCALSSRIGPVNRFVKARTVHRTHPKHCISLHFCTSTRMQIRWYTVQHGCFSIVFCYVSVIPLLPGVHLFDDRGSALENGRALLQTRGCGARGTRGSARSSLVLEGRALAL